MASNWAVGPSRCCQSAESRIGGSRRSAGLVSAATQRTFHEDTSAHVTDAGRPGATPPPSKGRCFQPSTAEKKTGGIFSFESTNDQNNSDVVAVSERLCDPPPRSKHADSAWQPASCRRPLQIPAFKYISYRRAAAWMIDKFSTSSTLKSHQGRVEKAGGLAAIHAAVWLFVHTFFAAFSSMFSSIGAP